jgi:hypothetical protein
MEGTFTTIVSQKLALLGVVVESGQISKDINKEFFAQAMGFYNESFQQQYAEFHQYQQTQTDALKILKQTSSGQNITSDEQTDTKILERYLTPISAMKEGKAKAAADYKEQYTTIGKNRTMDLRALRIFAPTYREGDLRNEQVKQQDVENYYDDIASGEQEKIRPHLDRIFREYLAVTPSMKMVEDDKHFLENATFLLEFSDRACYIENVIKDFPWYYNALPQETKETIKKRGKVEGLLGSMVMHKCNALGIDHNKGVALERTEQLGYVRQNAAAGTQLQLPMLKKAMQDNGFA